uniref:J domain-containing protein n=1 Tax=Macrostomum lignano TaxID=282301 RepID=A0A1I8F5Z3_9PLAT
MTIGIDFGVTKVTVGDRPDVKVNIFRLRAWPSVFYEVRNEFYRDVQGVMLVYDVTNRASFESLGGGGDAWIKEMKSELARRKHIANAARGYRYFETSALNGDGVSVDVSNGLFDGEFLVQLGYNTDRLNAIIEAVRVASRETTTRDCGIAQNALSVRRLAVLLHPDKSDRSWQRRRLFKILVNARNQLLL